MAIETTTVLAISCDNPECPGFPEEISGTSLTGWYLVTVEKYGESSQSYTFCCIACAASRASA